MYTKAIPFFNICLASIAFFSRPLLPQYRYRCWCALALTALTVVADVAAAGAGTFFRIRTLIQPINFTWFTTSNRRSNVQAYTIIFLATGFAFAKVCRFSLSSFKFRSQYISWPGLGERVTSTALDSAAADKLVLMTGSAADKEPDAGVPCTG